MGQEFPAWMVILGAMQALPEATGKGGASHELSSNGIWTMGDPKTAARDLGEESAERMVSAAPDFINAWKKVNK